MEVQTDSIMHLIPENQSLLDRVGMGGIDSFLSVGKEFASLAERLVGLGPCSRVLDVGCGVGRIAIPLTQVLDRRCGEYYGFDIDLESIMAVWNSFGSSETDLENFLFYHADLQNTYYRNGQGHSASSYMFPHNNGVFDIVLVISVFTHMNHADTHHYIQEIGRVLKEGGKALTTWFALTSDSTISVARGEQDPLLNINIGDPNSNLAFAAYEAQDIGSMIEDAGLTYKALHRGNWYRPGGEGLSYQDIVIMEKPIKAAKAIAVPITTPITTPYTQVFSSPHSTLDEVYD